MNIFLAVSRYFAESPSQMETKGDPLKNRNLHQKRAPLPSCSGLLLGRLSTAFRGTPPSLGKLVNFCYCAPSASSLE